MFPVNWKMPQRCCALPYFKILIATVVSACDIAHVLEIILLSYYYTHYYNTYIYMYMVQVNLFIPTGSSFVDLSRNAKI